MNTTHLNMLNLMIHFRMNAWGKNYSALTRRRVLQLGGERARIIYNCPIGLSSALLPFETHSRSKHTLSV